MLRQALIARSTQKMNSLLGSASNIFAIPAYSTNNNPTQSKWPLEGDRRCPEVTPSHTMTPRPGKAISLFQTQPKTADPPRGVPGAPETPPRHGQELHTTNDTLGRKIKTTGSQIHKLGPILRPDIWSSLLYYFVLKGPRTRPPGGSKISPTCEGVFNRKNATGTKKPRTLSQKCVFPSNLTHCCCGMNPQPNLKRPRVRPMALLTPKPPTRSLCEPTSSMPSATPPSGDPIRNPSAPARPSSSLPVRKIFGKG